MRATPRNNNNVIYLTICSANEDGVNSYQKMHGYNSHQVPHLKVFGSTAYVTIRRTTGKLDKRAKKCIFVGYADDHAVDCYRFFDPETGNIILSRDVMWSEILQRSMTDGKCDINKTSMIDSATAEQDVEEDTASDFLNQKSFKHGKERNVEKTGKEDPNKSDEHIDYVREWIEHGCDGYLRRPNNEPQDGLEIPPEESHFAQCMLANTGITVEDALVGPESKHWQQAIEKELNGLEEKKTFSTEPCPKA